MAGFRKYSNVKSVALSSTKYASILNYANHNASTSSRNHKTQNFITSGGSAHTTPALTVQSARPYVLALSLIYVFGAEGPGIAFAMDIIFNAISAK